MRKDIVRAEENHGMRKLQTLKQSKDQETKMGYLRRVGGEQDKMKRREAEIQDMERMEAELLERLKNTQAVEKDTYSQLETAIITAATASKERIKPRKGLAKTDPNAMSKKNAAPASHQPRKTEKPPEEPEQKKEEES